MSDLAQFVGLVLVAQATFWGGWFTRAWYTRQTLRNAEQYGGAQ